MAQSLVLILLVAGVLAVIMNRLRIPTIPAYLIGGTLFGPGGVGLIRGEQVAEVSGLAIVLLMFGVGMTLDISAIRGQWRTALVSTIISVVAMVAAFFPFMGMLGADGRGALILAIVLSNSSTAIVMRLLQQRRQLGRTRGRLATMLLVGQDVTMIGVLVLLPIIAAQGNAESTGESAIAAASAGLSFTQVLAQVGLGLLGLGAIVLVGKIVLPPLFAEAARMRSGEVLMVLAITFSIGSAVTTSSLGMSPELGAFLAGLMLSNTNFRHHLSGQIGTLRDLFIAVFFTTLGMNVDLSVIASSWPVILLMAGLVMLIKSIGIALACWLTGAALVTATNVGLMIAQGSEFGLVLMNLAAQGQPPLLGERTVAMTTGVIVVTMILTPLLFQLADRVPRTPAMRRTAPWFRPKKQAPAPPLTPATTPNADPPSETIGTHAQPNTRHVLVAGYGLVGRAVADRFRPSGISVTIIELNPKTVRDQQERGRSIVYGDIANPEVLETAGIHRADALILTIPDEEAVLSSCRVARQMNPQIFIVARTNVVSKGFLAKGLGADVAVIEELAAAEAMERIVGERLKKWKDRDDAGLPPNMTNM